MPAYKGLYATDELEGTVSSLPVPLGPACLCILRFPITIVLNRPRRALGPVPVGRRGHDLGAKKPA